MQSSPIPAKRQSLYTCIRYASRLMKIRTDIRKHRTLPNDCCDPYYSKEKYCADELNEKMSLSCPTCPAYQHETQPTKVTSYQETLDEKQAYETIVQHEKMVPEDDEDDEEEISSYYTDEYELTLQKLSGIQVNCHDNTTYTAVRIKMSPNALAAANAARQKRQKMRNNH
ncbi:hypothetical protein A0J61_04406 [Choanephora cucurbitarum]|uniref:Uncharacterized protein n=1 Tax=Choanephora cucurbitarum TaxID=101091 RepID=A0A1C7NF02_9FUNG|nr:hypothetical protein A0J61_04406 [Choanephora cucurbitarum]